MSRVLAGLGVMCLVWAVALAGLSPAQAEPTTIRVPQDHETVQAAVDAAAPGDTILVDRGTYPGDVFVAPGKDDLTIRGVDRNEVVFDGEDTRTNAILVRANGVTLENMTAHNYVANGFYWQSAEDYHGRYLTAYNVGLYAIYAFDSRGGLFEKSYGSGSGDSNFYIGQCFPCDAVIDDVISEYSALGYSGTNAGGNLVIKNSLWQNNATGIVPNSLDSEANPPQRQATIVDNTVRNNSNANTPATTGTGITIGNGIVIAGGVGNLVEGNTVTNHSKFGIVITPLPDQNLWIPSDNVIRNNRVSGSGLADLALAAGSGGGNCFEGNSVGLTLPPLIEALYSCGDLSGAALPVGGEPISLLVLLNDATQAQAGNPPRPSYTAMPAPEAQPTMPGVADAAALGGGQAGDGTETEVLSEVVPAEDERGALAASGGSAALGAVGLVLLAAAALVRSRVRS